jgi:ankyrin repeat protein
MSDPTLNEILQRNDAENALSLLKSSADLGHELRRTDNSRKFTVLHMLADSFTYTKELPPVVFEVAELLLKKGAELDARNVWGETPLMVALQNFRLSLAELFIERGADVLAVDDRGLSVLHWACNRASGGAHGEHLVKLVTRLLEAGADPDARCRKSNAPYFIERGASPLTLAREALMLSHELPNPELVKLLEATLEKRGPKAAAPAAKKKPAAAKPATKATGSRKRSRA